VVRLPSLITLAALGALALWGRQNAWQLSPSRAADQETAKPAAAEPAIEVREASPGPVRIEFPSASAVAKVGIRVAPVRVRDLTRSVTAPGMVDYDPGRYVRLSARASGSIVRVDKEIGDPVRKGDLLALLDAAEVGRLKADFLQDLAQVQLRSTTLQRLQEGYEKAAIPERSVLMAQTALRESRIRLLNDQQAMLNLGLPVRLEELQKLPDDQLARQLRLLGLPEGVARELDPDTLTANLLPLTAPFDGQVVERNVAVGEVVQVTQPKTLFVVGDVRGLHIDLDVNPEDMAGVRVGQPVTLRPNDGGPEASGRVVHISPEVNDKTRRVQVHAEVPNEDRHLRPNTFGTGQIVVAQRPRAVVVPGEAVQSDDHRSLVFVRISATAFEARPVRPGLRQGDLVEVSGVREGEEVVTAGSYLLMSELHKGRIAGGDD
jgi:cobalt-zinc-cadmium efflux system membrane fusion protein